MSIERTDLPSGLTVVTEQVPGTRSASFGCWVRVGGRDEAAEVAGASHFLEHLLFKGTATRTGREISEAIEAVGGEINAHTAHEHTAFYTRVPQHAASLGLELLAEVVSQPIFDDHDVDSERQVILEELHLAEDEGDDRVLSLAHEALWPEHPLGRDVLGDVDTIKSMSRADIAGFFDSHYHPSDLVLVAAGAVEHAAVVDVGAGFEARTVEARPPRVAPAGGPGPSMSLDRQHDVAHVALAWRGVPADDPDRYAVSVLNQILGGGLSSRLFQQIREERGLAYSVFSSICAYSDAGSIVAYAGTSPDRAAEVAHRMGEIVEVVTRRGVTEREWEVARGYLEGAAQLSLEDSGSVMGRLGNHVCAKGEVTPIEDQLAKLRAVTIEDVNRAARTHLGTEPVRCVVGPLDEIGL